MSICLYGPAPDILTIYEEPFFPHMSLLPTGVTQIWSLGWSQGHLSLLEAAWLWDGTRISRRSLFQMTEV